MCMTIVTTKWNLSTLPFRFCFCVVVSLSSAVCVWNDIHGKIYKQEPIWYMRFTISVRTQMLCALRLKLYHNLSSLTYNAHRALTMQKWSIQRHYCLFCKNNSRCTSLVISKKLVWLKTKGCKNSIFFFLFQSTAILSTDFLREFYSGRSIIERTY